MCFILWTLDIDPSPEYSITNIVRLSEELLTLGKGAEAVFIIRLLQLNFMLK